MAAVCFHRTSDVLIGTPFCCCHYGEDLSDTIASDDVSSLLDHPLLFLSAHVSLYSSAYKEIERTVLQL